MSRTFWDTMLFIYLLEDHPEHSERVRQLLTRARRRGDSLFTSYLVLGEIMAGSNKSPNPGNAQSVREIVREMGFTCLPFDEGAVAPFSRLRSKEKVRIADAIHLACAASAGIDLFLTGDKQLVKLDIPGIQFIAEFNTPIL
ncbi:MAG: PIN domain-containing protein [Terracidiphilus sp.]|jgi:predicted nucleic acid-binding protein